MRKKKNYFNFILLLTLILFNPNFFFSFIFVSKRDNIHINNENVQKNYQKLDINIDLPALNYKIHYYNWFNPKIDMLIILPNQSNFSTTMQSLLEWKNKRGWFSEE